MTFEEAIMRMIEHLRSERERVETAMARLGEVRVAKSKRGRKSMSADERAVVSQRMRNYWAARRAEHEVCVVVPAGVTVTRSFEDALLAAAGAQFAIDGQRRLFYLHGTQCQRTSIAP